MEKRIQRARHGKPAAQQQGSGEHGRREGKHQPGQARRQRAELLAGSHRIGQFVICPQQGARPDRRVLVVIAAALLHRSQVVEMFAEFTLIAPHMAWRDARTQQPFAQRFKRARHEAPPSARSGWLPRACPSCWPGARSAAGLSVSPCNRPGCACSPSCGAI